MYRDLIELHADGHLNCFQTLAIFENTSMKTLSRRHFAHVWTERILAKEVKSPSHYDKRQNTEEAGAEESTGEGLETSA